MLHLVTVAELSRVEQLWQILCPASLKYVLHDPLRKFASPSSMERQFWDWDWVWRWSSVRMDNKRCSPIFLSNQGILKWEGMGHSSWWRKKFVVKPKQYQPSETLGRNKPGEPSPSLCELMAGFLVCAVVHLILFYENRLKDHHLVIPSVLRGLRALVSPFFFFITNHVCRSPFPVNSPFALWGWGFECWGADAQCATKLVVSQLHFGFQSDLL